MPIKFIRFIVPVLIYCVIFFLLFNILKSFLNGGTVEFTLAMFILMFLSMSAAFYLPSILYKSMKFFRDYVSKIKKAVSDDE